MRLKKAFYYGPGILKGLHEPIYQRLVRGSGDQYIPFQVMILKEEKPTLVELVSLREWDQMKNSSLFSHVVGIGVVRNRVDFESYLMEEIVPLVIKYGDKRDELKNIIMGEIDENH